MYPLLRSLPQPGCCPRSCLQRHQKNPTFVLKSFTARYPKLPRHVIVRLYSETEFQLYHLRVPWWQQAVVVKTRKTLPSCTSSAVILSLLVLNLLIVGYTSNSECSNSHEDKRYHNQEDKRCHNNLYDRQYTDTIHY